MSTMNDGSPGASAPNPASHSITERQIEKARQASEKSYAGEDWSVSDPATEEVRSLSLEERKRHARAAFQGVAESINYIAKAFGNDGLTPEEEKTLGDALGNGAAHWITIREGGKVQDSVFAVTVAAGSAKKLVDRHPTPDPEEANGEDESDDQRTARTD